jgi:hypothetical protein
VLSALAICAISFSGCENGFCRQTDNPGLQFLGSLLGCTSDDVFEDDLPTASFSVSPSSPRVGETVTFDGSASSPGNTLTAVQEGIARFEWDTDGDNRMDPGGTIDPTLDPENPRPNPYRIVRKVYTRPGRVIVRLRVINSEGVFDTTERVITVLPASGGGPGPPGNPTPRPRFAATAAAATSTVTVFGKVTGTVRDGRVVGGASARLGLSGPIRREGAKPSAPTLVRRLLGGRWTLGVTSARAGRVRARALVTTGRGGPQACASITLSPARGKGVQRGTLTLLGGSGAARTVRVTVKFLARSPGFSLLVLGTLRATTGAAARGLPRSCLPPLEGR